MRLSTPIPTGRRRGGFTLVELLVAAALSVLVMTILAQAFSTALDTTSGLKAVGSLADQIRSTGTTLRGDLDPAGATHLEDEFGVPRRMRDVPVGGWPAPNKGYFRIVQGSAAHTAPLGTPGNAAFPEGTDPDGAINPDRATDHWFAFTNRLNGRSAGNVFTAAILPVTGETVSDYSDAGRWAALRSQSLRSLTDNAAHNPPAGSTGLFVGQWAEIIYFLRPNGQTTDGTTGTPLNLHTLYRQVRLLVPNQMGTTPAVASPLPPTPPGLQLDTTVTASDINPTVVSGRPLTQISTFDTNRLTEAATDGRVNTPSTIIFLGSPAPAPEDGHRPYPSQPPAANTAPPATPPIPFGFANATTEDTGNPHLAGDILLGNVVSMRLQVLTAASVTLLDLPTPPPTTPSFPRVWDTAAPGAFRPSAISIKLRVYDTKNQVTRQMTVLQPI